MYQSRLVQIYSDTQLLYTLYIAAAFGLLLVCVALVFLMNIFFSVWMRLENDSLGHFLLVFSNRDISVVPRP